MPALVVAALTLSMAAPGARAEVPLGPQGPSPPGANDPSCRPSPLHPYPVILVHGTFGDMAVSWNSLAPALERLGYCVEALDYGNSPLPGINAVGDIPTSAAQLGTFVDRVLAQTGAAKVSIVGHSQGGMMPRYYIRFLGGAGKVDDLVGLSPSNHGTTTPLAGPGGLLGCPACAQQVAGSAFLAQLNASDATPPPVSYTVIETNHDGVVTPYYSEFLVPEGGRVTNVLLQDRCPLDLIEHAGIILDPVALQWVLDALGRPGPADPSFQPDCSGAALATFPNSSSVGAPSRGGSDRRGSRRAVRLRLGRVLHPRRGLISFTLTPVGGHVRGVVIRLRTRGRRVAGLRIRMLASSRRIVLHAGDTRGRGRLTLTAVGRDDAGRTVRVLRWLR